VSRLRSEAGFTLVELLITTVIMTLVFGGVLGVLDAFQRQASANNGRGDNQDAARRTVDRMSDSLRAAVGAGTALNVERATPTDVVFRMVDPATPPQSTNPGRLMFRRYCLDDATSSVLYEEDLHWAAAAPSLPSTACPGTGWEDVQQIADHITTVAGPLFSYPPNTTPVTAVSRVAIDLSIDLKPNQPPAATTLHTSVDLRNAVHPPTAGISCQAYTPGQIYCDAGGTANLDGGTLTYAWSYGTSCATATGGSFPSQPQISQNGLNIGTSYCFKLVVTNQAGLPDTATYTVTAT
jgi:type II secretory pathway component PulJ